MFYLECPKCSAKLNIKGEDLPETACDDFEYECPKCGEMLKVGWYPVVEIR